MSTATLPATRAPSPSLDPVTLEKVLVQGDLAKLSPAERLSYYRARCESTGLDPLSRPFDYIVLNGKLTLYANRGCTDQLRRLHGVSVVSLDPRQVGDCYVVTCNVRDREGRTDSATGAVSIAGLRGDSLANAFMKGETKAKRRATLSLCGLGMLDESEVETIPDARLVGPEIDQAALPAAGDQTDELTELPRRGESWADWSERTTTTANTEWANELAVEGVPKADRAKLIQHRLELTNYVVSRGIKSGAIGADDVAGPTGKRNKAKAEHAAADLFRRAPKKIASAVLLHIADKWDEARKALAPAPVPTAERPGDGNPPPGKGDAYEGDLTDTDAA